MSNPLGFIEIPVTDCERALSFYNTVFDWTLSFETVGASEMAYFPASSKAPGASGALVYEQPFYEPSSTYGPLVYFTCDDAGTAAERSERAGGRIEIPKTPVPEPAGGGYISVVIDTEGNRIGFHSEV